MKSHGYCVFSKGNSNSHCSTIYSLDKAKISYFLANSCTFFKTNISLYPMINYEIFVYPIQISVMLKEHFRSKRDLIVF